MRKQLKHTLIASVIGVGILAASNSVMANASSRPVFSREAQMLYSEAVHSFRTRHFTLAKKQFRTLIEKYPDDGYAEIARSNLGQLLVSNHEYEEAIALYKEVIDRSASRPEEADKARIELTDILYKIHRFRDGIEILEDWHKKEPGNPECARKLAAFYLSSGGTNEAWLLLERFMEMGNKDAFKDLLNLAVKSGEIDKLLSSLESRRAKYKQSVYIDFVSDCYIAMGRKDKAIEALKEAPDYQKQSSILRKLADIQISDNKINDAAETLETLCRLVPNDNQGIKKLGHCYFVQGKKEKAIETWRKNLNSRFGRSQQSYMDYTSILIEHQLLDEALEAFEEARRELYQESIFAEEKAAVLMALNRNAEAMEEYLKVLMLGTYKTEMFDKLYEADGKSFDLEKRLTDLHSQDYGTAITQSLIEYYFRKANIADIEKMVALVDGQSAIFFDDLFYNRLRQEALLVPEQFHFALLQRMMKERRNSALELKLAALVLKMPDYNEKWLLEAYTSAKAAAESTVIADADLKYNLCIRLAEFAFYIMKKPDEAAKFLEIVINADRLKPEKKYQIEARLFRAKLQTYSGKFDEATSTLEQVGEMLKNSNNTDSIEHDEFQEQYLFEDAMLKCHMGEFQDALYALKDIIDTHKEGVWVNDSLELANDVTRLSFGDFSVLKHKLAADRAIACNRSENAISELDAAIKEIPASSTALIAEFEADKLLASDKKMYDEALMKKIDVFTLTHKDCYKNPDLRELKIKLMQRGNASKDKTNEEMRSFISQFPNDLRSGKYKQSLENGGKN